MASTERMVAIDGATLRVVEEGTGTPVLVPSGAGITFYQNTFSARLLRDLRLIYIEMRGTGGSTGTVAGCTFASLADDVDQVRAAIGLDRAIVMGHSNHGCIALEHALRHPEHCAATLSVASGPDFSHTFSTGQARWDLEASAEQKAALARRQAEFEAIDKRGLNADETSIRNYQAVAPLVFRDLNVDAKSLWGEIPRGAGEYMQRVIIQQGAEWNLVPELPKIAAPVLAICGRYDYVCPVELWVNSIDRLPAGRLEIFEHSAHNPQYEERDRFDTTVLEFVHKHS
jgi:proline iminopeptidase